MGEVGQIIVSSLRPVILLTLVEPGDFCGA